MNISNWKAFHDSIDWSATGSSISAIAAVIALWYTHQQWKKIKAKIGMISDTGKAAEVLPAWYTTRMMSDDWLFGLLTKAGYIVVIRKILAISDDSNWMDVELAEAIDLPANIKDYGKPVAAVATDRTRASLRIDIIVVAIDLQSS